MNIGALLLAARMCLAPGDSECEDQAVVITGNAQNVTVDLQLHPDRDTREKCMEGKTPEVLWGWHVSFPHCLPLHDRPSGCKAEWTLRFPSQLLMAGVTSTDPNATIGFDSENCDGPQCTQKVWRTSDYAGAPSEDPNTFDYVLWGAIANDPNNYNTILSAHFRARASSPEVGHYEIGTEDLRVWGMDPNTGGCTAPQSYLFMFGVPYVDVGLCDTDEDDDKVCDRLDNCQGVPNPRRPKGYLEWFPWATLTGRQRDDDADGYGNKCDADFDQQGVIVGGPDVTHMRYSVGKFVDKDECGLPTNQTMPCAIFDLDEEGRLIGGPDITNLKFQVGQPHNDSKKCPTCPLECTAGTEGHCP